jgi:hypothetical protein
VILRQRLDDLLEFGENVTRHTRNQALGLSTVGASK